MSGTNQARRTRNNRHRWWRVFHRTAVFSAMLFLVAEVAVVAVSSVARESGDRADRAGIYRHAR
jgi:hypothetical protein